MPEPALRASRRLATVYRWVAASPEEVMAVYANFDNQAGYLPRLVESRIVGRFRAERGERLRALTLVLKSMLDEPS